MPKVFTVAWREFTQTVFRPIFVIAVLGMPVLILGIMAIAGVMMVSHKEPPLVGTIAIAEASGRVAEAAAIEFTVDAIEKDEERQAEQAKEQLSEMAGAGGGVVPATGAIPVQRGEIRIDIEAIKETGESIVERLIDRVRGGDIIAAAIVQPSALTAPPSRSAPVHSDTPRSEGDGIAPNEPANGSREANMPPSTPGVRLLVGESLDSDHVRLIERRLGQSVVRVRLAEAGLDPEQAFAIMKRPSVETARALASGEEKSEGEGQRVAKMMIPMAFMMLIWIGAFTSGQHLMMSTIEEKSNRVMEVLLSAVSPMQLMTGKIFGHGGVGLLIVGIYSSVGIGALIILAVFSQFVSIIDLVYLAVFYFMAYFMVAAMMAAVGSAVSDIREANTLVTPVMMILMVPLMLWMPISQAPNGIVAQIFSFLPPAIPFAMILRMAAEEPVPTWQMVASIVWGYICVFGMVWGAAKIFRIGVLMYGKPPTPVELIKWLRYS